MIKASSDIINNANNSKNEVVQELKSVTKAVETVPQEILSEAVSAGKQTLDIITKDSLLAFNFGDISLAVNDLIDKSVDDIVTDELRKIRFNTFVDSSLGDALGTAEIYYKKILNSQHIMTSMRNNYTSALTKNINNVINDKLNDLTGALGGKYARKILARSKLASVLTNVVNTQVSGVINAIINDKMIADVSNDIITTVNKLKSSAEQQIQTTFKNEIAYYKKIEKSVQDQIQKFEQQKQIYQQKLQAEVQRLKDAINAEIKKVEKAIVNEISKVIKIDAGSFGF